MKNALIAAMLAGVACTPAGVLAQEAAPTASPAAPMAAVGAKVFGPTGVEVGTIESVEGGNVVLNTGARKATLPVAALGRDAKGLLISMTKEQLEAAVVAAEAKASSTLAAALVPGAAIRTSDGTPAGKITAVAGRSITVALPSGKSIVLTPEFMVADASGVRLKMDNAAFQSAVAQATGTSAEAAVAADGGSGASTAASGTSDTDQ